MSNVIWSQIKFNSLLSWHYLKLLMMCIGSHSNSNDNKQADETGEMIPPVKGSVKVTLTGSVGSHPQAERRRSCRPGDIGRYAAAGWWGSGSTLPGGSAGSLRPSGCPASLVLRTSKSQKNEKTYTEMDQWQNGHVLDGHHFGFFVLYFSRRLLQTSQTPWLKTEALILQNWGFLFQSNS